MDPDIVILDGFHALKHALRFGGEIVDMMMLPDSNWRAVATELAPDVLSPIQKRLRVVTETEFRIYSPKLHPTRIVALARRPNYATNPELNTARKAPAVLLENPRRLGNVGAVIRVVAGVGATGVTVFGETDPWHPASIRGSAGLHFAVPVTQTTNPDDLAGPLVVMDPDGEPLSSTSLHPGSLLVFGTERQGVSESLKRRADKTLSLPMRPGVSSLNLATSVAATLYYWRLSNARYSIS